MQLTDDDLAAAIAALKAGQVIGLPTETVYGLAGDAASADAVAAIFRTKGRPADHPLIVHVVDDVHARKWVDWTETARALAEAFWPGPLTMLLPRLPGAPSWAAAGRDSLGIRCPSHPVAQRLLRAAADAGIDGLAAPSANRFGRISPTRAVHVRDEFGDAVPVVLDAGASEIGIESTIVDLTGDVPVLRRPGRIRRDDLERVLRVQVAGRAADRSPGATTAAGSVMPPSTPDTTSDEMQAVSGELPAHYAPRTAMRMVNRDALAETVWLRLSTGQRVAVWSAHSPVAARDAADRIVWRAMPMHVDAVEQSLYATLRELDACGADLIIVESPPVGGDWAAVCDRLGRAQTGSGYGGLNQGEAYQDTSGRDGLVHESQRRSAGDNSAC